MPLSWNEIRARAARFADEWKDAHYEKGETQTFYNEFFEVFGNRRRNVAVYEEKVKKLSGNHGFVDLFWPGHLLIEQKSAGRDLAKARVQATDYFVSLTEKEKPRYILLSDFQTFELLDLEENEERRFSLAELADNVRHFAFIAGYQQQKYRDQDPANIEASELMSNLHKHLEESGYTGHDLERLLVRIMFCLFAEDTGIFPMENFLRLIEDRTEKDGSDLGSWLIHLFQVLNTPDEKRQKNLDEDLAAFPYVNGNLFADAINIPSFDTDMREALLKCAYFNWTKVSPALFGSLFQTVMLPAEQRQGGAHYTSEKNILKIIHPLFLDELREEFEHIKTLKVGKQQRFEQFHDKLANLTFFDPACGCGNFLILAMRELRELELDVLGELYPAKNRQTVLDIGSLTKVSVDQFYGIEIEEFPARIAEAAMWLVDHQMNMRLSESFGQAYVRLPLTESAHIYHGNALTTNWADVLPPKKCSYTIADTNIEADIQAVVDASAKLADSVEPLITEKLEVLQAAQNYAGKLTEDDKHIDCPACGESVKGSQFIQHIKTEQERLQEIIQVFSKRKSAISTLVDTLKLIKNNLAKPNLKEWLEKLKEGELKDNITWIEQFDPESIRQAVSNTTLEDIKENFQPVVAAADDASRDAPPDIKELSDDKNLIEAAKAVFLAEALKNEVDSIENLVNFLAALEKGTRDEIRERSKAIIKDISNDIQDMWKILHPSEPIKNVHLYDFRSLPRSG